MFFRWRKANPSDVYDQTLTYHEGSGKLVVFVHGLTGDYKGSWGRMPEFIGETSDYNVLLLGYPSRILLRSPNVDALGEYLMTQIRNRCAPYAHVVLVGHSLGGLVIQAAIVGELARGHANEAYIQKIDHIVLYAPPLEGNDVALIVERLGVPVSGQVKQLVTSNPWLNNLKDQWVNNVYRPIITDGNYAHKRHIPTTIVVGLNDVIVPRDKAMSVYSDPSLEAVPGDHTTLKLPKSADDIRFVVLRNRLVPSGNTPGSTGDTPAGGSGTGGYRAPADAGSEFPAQGASPSPLPHPAIPTPDTTAPSTVLAHVVEQLGTDISGETSRIIDRLRREWREGKRDEALAGVRQIRENNARWPFLSRDVQAKVLRLEVPLVLDIGGDIAEAKRLAQSARGLALKGDAKTQALIAYKEDGPDAALRALLAGDGEGDDTDTATLRCALLLDLGRVDDCRRILDAEGSRIEPQAEGLRLRALLHFVDGDMDGAQLSILEALELEPRWIESRLTAAMIAYYRAMSPCAVPDHVPAIPDPVDWALIKRDDESLRLLDEAAALCRSCAADAPHERARIEAWLLGCLANRPDPVTQQDASALCSARLARDATDYCAIAWAVARGFPVDLVPSERVILDLLSAGRADIPHVIALATYYLGAGANGARQALALLAGNRALFEGRGREVLWTSWYAQAQAHGGDVAGALATIDAFPTKDDLRSVRALALRIRMSETGEWRPLVAHLEDSYKATGKAIYLYDCCAVMFGRGDWAYVAQHARALVDECGTAATLEIAAIAAYRANEYDPCLTLLDAHRGFFAHGQLPAHIGRIRIACQVAMGIVSEAVLAAEELARDEPTAANVAQLLQIYYDKGDLPSLSIAARRLERHPDLTPRQALWAAEAVPPDAIELARRLWRRAVALGVPDELVSSALLVGTDLGLDDEFGPLHERMATLAREGRGDIVLMSLEDIPSFAQEKRDRDAELGRAYVAGDMPIHLIASALGRPLVHLYHRFLEDNVAMGDPMARFPLFARHGNRAFVTDGLKTGGTIRLHMDITALLLAAHVGILPAVERAFHHLYIPSGTARTLARMRADLSRTQRSLLPAYQEVVDLVDRGDLHVLDGDIATQNENSAFVEEMGQAWVDLYHRTCRDDGYLLDFFPVRTATGGVPTAFPAGATGRLVNGRTILAALTGSGTLSEDAHARFAAALDAAGGGGGDVVDVRPAPRAALYCHGIIPEVLARAGVLRTVCTAFTVHIERREVDRVRAELSAYERAQRDEAWLDGLLDRVRDGIEQGTYQVMPSYRHDDADDVSRDGDQASGFRGLLDLFRYPAEPGDVLWVDDRFVTGLSHRDGIPIVGITDVLASMARSGDLPIDAYHATIIAMRAARVCYISLDRDEILYHLRQARIVAGRVVETEELAILRPYVAACLAGADALRRPPNRDEVPQRPGEDNVVFSIAHAVNGALGWLWAADEDDDACQARAEWLLDALYIDQPTIHSLVRRSGSREMTMHVVAVGLVNLLVVMLPPVSFGAPVDDRARRRYMVWLFERILRRHFEDEPHLAGTVADVVANTLSAYLEGCLADGESGHQVVGRLRAFYGDLPKQLQDELGRHAGFMERIGIVLRATIGVGDLVFDRDDFLRAAGQAINGRDATVVAIDPAMPVALHAGDGGDEQAILILAHPHTGENMVVEGDDLDLLRDSPSAREASLRHHREWFDCSDAELHLAVARIVVDDDPLARIEGAASWREASAAVYYDDLSSHLRGHAQFRDTELPPPTMAGLLRHLRLAPDVGVGVAFRAALHAAAWSIMHEESLVTALDRLSGLPVPLPASLRTAIADLSPSERRLLVKQAIARPGSPISKVHLLAELLHRAADNSADGREREVYRRLARRVAWSLGGADRNTAEEMEAFLAVLRWASDEIGWWPQARDLAPHVRLLLVWAHAHRLFMVFRAAGATVPWFLGSFGQTGARLPRETFGRENSYHRDVAYPWHVDRERFRVAGVLHALDGVPQFTQEILRASGATTQGTDEWSRLSLLRDVSRADNALESFLGRDLVDPLSALMPVPNAVTQDSLRTMIDEAVRDIGLASGNAAAWNLVELIARDMPLHGEAAVRFGEILKGVDISTLLSQDEHTGMVALRVTTLQIANYEDADVRRHLRLQVIESVRILARRTSSPERDRARGVGRDEITGVIFALALQLSVSRSTSSDEAVASFAALLADLITAWDAIIPFCRPRVQRLYETLPGVEAQHLAPVLFLLRARA